MIGKPIDEAKGITLVGADLHIPAGLRVPDNIRLDENQLAKLTGEDK